MDDSREHPAATACALPAPSLAAHRQAALRRRLDALDGEARRLVELRLAQLQGDTPAAVETTRQQAPARGALAALVEALDARRAQRDVEAGVVATTARLAPADDPTAAATPAPQARAATPVDDLRKIWSEVRTRSQVQRSLQKLPGNAGPLNSGTLVHRALTLMRDVSPAYLQHFMAYVDALAGLEALRGPALPAPAAPLPRRSAPRGTRQEPKPKAKAKPKARPRKSKRLIPRPEPAVD